MMAGEAQSRFRPKSFRPGMTKIKVTSPLPVQEVDNIAVLQFFHHQDLIDDQLFLWLFLQVDLFDRHLGKDRCGYVSCLNPAPSRVATSQTEMLSTQAEADTITSQALLSKNMNRLPHG